MDEFKAESGKFLLVTHSNLPRVGLETHEFDQPDAAHTRASEFWTTAHLPTRADVYDDQGRKVPPASYIDAKRPPLAEAMELEAIHNAGMTIAQAVGSLTKKGYFTAPPRPWQVVRKERGHDHGDYAVLDRFGSLVVTTVLQETAEFIVGACNACSGPG